MLTELEMQLLRQFGELAKVLNEHKDVFLTHMAEPYQVAMLHRDWEAYWRWQMENVDRYWKSYPRLYSALCDAGGEARFHRATVRRDDCFEIHARQISAFAVTDLVHIDNSAAEELIESKARREQAMDAAHVLDGEWRLGDQPSAACDKAPDRLGHLSAEPGPEGDDQQFHAG